MTDYQKILRYFKKHPSDGYAACATALDLHKTTVVRVMTKAVKAGEVVRVPMIPHRWEFKDGK